ncbi:hypothetical protein V1291_000918 [Nitrobacteraceae bacterium AZCC 1564]
MMGRILRRQYRSLNKPASTLSAAQRIYFRALKRVVPGSNEFGRRHPI